MNYFGVEKRVKVVDKVTPRDMDRSKMFTQVPPVIMKKYTLKICSHLQNYNILKNLIGINILKHLIRFEPDRVRDISIFTIEATDTQVTLVSTLSGVLEIKEIVNE